MNKITCWIVSGFVLLCLPASAQEIQPFQSAADNNSHTVIKYTRSDGSVYLSNAGSSSWRLLTSSSDFVPWDVVENNSMSLIRYTRSSGVEYISRNGGQTWNLTDEKDEFFPASESQNLNVESEHEADSQDAEVVSLSQNPTAGITAIEYQLSSDSEVRISLHMVNGTKLLQLVDGAQSAGSHRATFDAATLANGVYFYRVYIDASMYTGKIVVAR